MKSQWVIRKFKKNKAVRTIVHYPDLRVKTIWCIPKDNLITIDKRTYRCDTKVDYFSLWNGIPTFTYKYDRVEPIRVDDKQDSQMTSDEFNVAINNKVVEEIFRASDKKMDLITIAIFAMVAIAIIVAVAGFFLYKEMQSMKDMLDNLNKFFGIGGVASGS